LRRRRPPAFTRFPYTTLFRSDMVELAFRAAGIEDWERYVRADERFLRPADVEELTADPSKARRVLGWEPSMGFEDLIAMMVESEDRKSTRLNSSHVAISYAVF